MYMYIHIKYDVSYARFDWTSLIFSQIAEVTLRKLEKNHDYFKDRK